AAEQAGWIYHVAAATVGLLLLHDVVEGASSCFTGLQSRTAPPTQRREADIVNAAEGCGAEARTRGDAATLKRENKARGGSRRYRGMTGYYAELRRNKSGPSA
ncbi:unnamed protein product, partial [Amoebophrya sp. A120]